MGSSVASVSDSAGRTMMIAAVLVLYFCVSIAIISLPIWLSIDSTDMFYLVLGAGMADAHRSDGDAVASVFAIALLWPLVGLGLQALAQGILGISLIRHGDPISPPNWALSARTIAGGLLFGFLVMGEIGWSLAIFLYDAVGAHGLVWAGIPLCLFILISGFWIIFWLGHRTSAARDEVCRREGRVLSVISWTWLAIGACLWLVMVIFTPSEPPADILGPRMVASGLCGLSFVFQASAAKWALGLRNRDRG